MTAAPTPAAPSAGLARARDAAGGPDPLPAGPSGRRAPLRAAQRRQGTDAGPGAAPTRRPAPNRRAAERPTFHSGMPAVGRRNESAAAPCAGAAQAGGDGAGGGGAGGLGRAGPGHWGVRPGLGTRSQRRRLGRVAGSGGGLAGLESPRTEEEEGSEGARRRPGVEGQAMEGG